jgi:hypothetical protein
VCAYNAAVCVVLRGRADVLGRQPADQPTLADYYARPGGGGTRCACLKGSFVNMTDAVFMVLWRGADVLGQQPAD